MDLGKAAIAAILLGIFLVVSSFFCGQVLEPSDVWSSDAAEEYNRSAMNLHNQTFVSAEKMRERGLGEADVIDDPDLRAAERDFNAKRKSLDKAIALKSRLPMILRVVGCVLAAIGIAANSYQQQR